MAGRNSDNKVWFITGCSKGLGRALAETVIRQGHRAAVTARDTRTLDALVALAPERVLALTLDVNSEAQAHEAVRQTIGHFGRIDVLVNNAGYGLAGAVEEVSDAEARAQMETNVFGVLKLTRAALPPMRAQKSGHILNISSVAGVVSTPGLGIYNASKYALEGFSEALAQELAPLGIKVTLIEPGPFRTDWAGPSLATPQKMIGDYADTAHKTIQMLNGYSGQQPGDPHKAAVAMMLVVDSPKPPLRLPLGEMAVGRIRHKLATMTAELDAWEQVALDTSFRQG
ncbi:MAG: SDR family NAD(P)-dependent oxidoreductase [Nevskiaceae bacterium]|nr:MAG: SDR family NAD(P)-dependent oxidoreductase [Nevskiaceae bacterium]